MYYVDMNAKTKTMMVKSGTDFKNVSWMQVQLNNDKDGIEQSEQAQSYTNICIFCSLFLVYTFIKHKNIKKSLHTKRNRTGINQMFE